MLIVSEYGQSVILNRLPNLILLRKKKQHIRISVLETKLWDNFEESESEE
jgi:hypothetical protein